jgi:cytoskeletal protein CcmA (bactofilin family)
MNAGEGKTMIGKSVKIVGDLSGSEDLTMDGELQGTIRLPGARLTIGPAARVRGDVAAKDIVIFGRLEGDIRAVGRVELRASALVQGNIFAGSLSMEENAAFRGEVDPSRAGEPIPERASPPAPPVAAARPSAPASYLPADGSGISIARGPTQLPAALAAVAAAHTAATETARGGDEDASQPAPLFAETEV